VQEEEDVEEEEEEDEVEGEEDEDDMDAEGEEGEEEEMDVDDNDDDEEEEDDDEEEEEDEIDLDDAEGEEGEESEEEDDEFRLPTEEEEEEEKRKVPQKEMLESRVQEVLRVLVNFKERRREEYDRADYLDRLIKDLATLHGYVPFLINLFLQLFPPAEAIEFLTANDNPRPLTIRANTLKTRRKDLAQALISRSQKMIMCFVSF
jgi:ribosomal RNA methyltransferase Nop2